MARGCCLCCMLIAMKKGELDHLTRLECGREEEKCCEVILVTSQVGQEVFWVLLRLFQAGGKMFILREGEIFLVPLRLSKVGPSPGLPSFVHGGLCRKGRVQRQASLRAHRKVKYLFSSNSCNFFLSCN